MKTVRRLLPKQLGRFLRNRAGVSAVEFAMVAPLMISLYLGGTEISQGISVDRKLTLTAGAVANLAAQVQTISNADMSNIFDASSSVMSPYSTSVLKMTVSSLNVDATGKVTVLWSETRGGSARSVGSVVTIPTALAVPNTTLIFSEVSYAYKPAIGYTITGTLNLSDQMFMAPRLSTSVARTS